MESGQACSLMMVGGERQIDRSIGQWYFVKFKDWLCTSINLQQVDEGDIGTVCPSFGRPRTNWHFVTVRRKVWVYGGGVQSEMRQQG
jgi:hypothetical protein